MSTYETQKPNLADINILSNDENGRAIGNTNSGKENLSDDLHNDEFYFCSMTTRSPKGVNFIKSPHLVKYAKNPDCHVKLSMNCFYFVAD